MSKIEMTRFEMMRYSLLLILLISAVWFVGQKYTYYNGFHDGQASIVNQLNLVTTIDGTWVVGANCAYNISQLNLTVKKEGEKKWQENRLLN